MESTLKERLNPDFDDQMSIRVHTDHARRAEALRPFVGNLPALTERMSSHGATRPAVLRVALEMGLRLLDAIQSNPSLNVKHPLLVAHRDHVDAAAKLVEKFQNPPKSNRRGDRGERSQVLFCAIEMGLIALETSSIGWSIQDKTED